jgi:5S rRNA maturation endonuclease (ribonuclease M5)
VAKIRSSYKQRQTIALDDFDRQSQEFETQSISQLSNNLPLHVDSQLYKKISPHSITYLAVLSLYKELLKLIFA